MARCDDDARILAFVVEACESIGAIGVDATLGLFFETTIDLGIANVSRRTTAARQVLTNATFGSSCASIILVDARIYALFIDASTIARTISVAVASNDVTSVPRIAEETLATTAFRSMIDHEAFCVCSATFVSQQTWIHAYLIDATLVAIALRIASTLDRRTSHFRITLVAFHARTNWLVIPHETICVATAIARISTATIHASLSVTAFVVARTSTRDVERY